MTIPTVPVPVTRVIIELPGGHGEGPMRACLHCGGSEWGNAFHLPDCPVPALLAHYNRPHIIQRGKRIYLDGSEEP